MFWAASQTNFCSLGFGVSVFLFIFILLPFFFFSFRQEHFFRQLEGCHRLAICSISNTTKCSPDQSDSREGGKKNKQQNYEFPSHDLVSIKRFDSFQFLKSKNGTSSLWSFIRDVCFVFYFDLQWISGLVTLCFLRFQSSPLFTWLRRYFYSCLTFHFPVMAVQSNRLARHSATTSLYDIYVMRLWRCAAAFAIAWFSLWDKH